MGLKVEGIKSEISLDLAVMSKIKFMNFMPSTLSLKP
jgi:hypothetical protein